MNEFIIDFFDFFLPRFCPACQVKLKAGEKYVCHRCMKKMRTADDSRIAYEFKRKFEAGKIISGFVSLYVFEKDKELQNIIHSLKYNQKFLIGKYLGMQIGKSLNEIFGQWALNLIIPVPLHPVKKAERGYNQSFYLAKGLSRETGIPISTRILKRVRSTDSQTTMTLEERRENVKAAFKAVHSDEIKRENILLIDDVITTGATISECGKILLNAGAAKIYAASAAIAD